MKKIILNGCSWVAGDEIAWDLFCEQHNLVGEDYASFLERGGDPELFSKYQNVFRKDYNQASYLKRYLNTEIIDLSTDGMSNDALALSTIDYILSLPKEQRSNYHVIVAWTLVHRLLTFLNPHWENIHVGHIENGLDSRMKKYERKIEPLVLLPDQEDWYVNYVKNVFLLESFLKNNNVTYTFYRSLGALSEWIHRENDLTYKMKVRLPDSHHGVSLSHFTPDFVDCSNWLIFYPDQQNLAFCSDSWTSYCEDTQFGQWSIGPHNKHPHRKTTDLLSQILSKHIIDKGYLE